MAALTRSYEKTVQFWVSCSVNEADFSCGGRLFQRGPIQSLMYIMCRPCLGLHFWSKLCILYFKCYG